MSGVCVKKSLGSCVFSEKERGGAGRKKDVDEQ